MMRMAFLIVGLSGLQIAHAQPKVLADYGGTPLPWTQDQHYIAAPVTPEKIPFSYTFPVQTKALRPGVVSRSTLATTTTTPAFVIGYDSRSFVWLRQNKTRLVELHAQGLVVNVLTLQQFNQLKEFAAPLSLSPVNGDDFYHQMKIQHYPFLILGNEVLP